jgi:FKBP-type peptidyl-prolyl cis-trans isomerase
MPLAKKRGHEAAEREKKAGSQVLADALATEGAVLLDCGAVMILRKEGKGKHPAATDSVEVNYRGTLGGGTVFDESKKPAKFPLNGVIPCWTEGMQRLRSGGKARLVCPSKTAYGDQGRPPKIPGGATLVFEVELLRIATGQ